MKPPRFEIASIKSTFTRRLVTVVFAVFLVPLLFVISLLSHGIDAAKEIGEVWSDMSENFQSIVVAWKGRK